jgi:hypothetical protein
LLYSGTPVQPSNEASQLNRTEQRKGEHAVLEDANADTDIKRDHE